jgi:hypothetical protein
MPPSDPLTWSSPDYLLPVLLPRLLLLVFSALILSRILVARKRSLFIRRIPGLTAVDEAVGRATEMGRPITFSLGLGGLDVITLQSLAIAIHVLRKAIQFGNRMIITMRDATIYAIADDAVREAYTQEGRPEGYRVDDVRFLSDRQFAYASAMVGLIHREKAASCFMFGTFFAESLVLAEAGNQVGAIQVAGTPTTTQVPFFIASCDYTIIGDEYYAATAYLSREPVLLGSLVGQDYGKMLLLAFATLGILFASLWYAVTGQPVTSDAMHVRTAPVKMPKGELSPPQQLEKWLKAGAR